MEALFLSLYFLCLLAIFFFSFSQFHLALLHRRFRKRTDQPAGSQFALPFTDWPAVTVQVPIYNEKYVARRVIDAVCAFQYPSHLLHIQVLDDSTDETLGLVAEAVAEWQAKGRQIWQITRPTRQGFKAGALQYGLQYTQDAFIAIFDADFIPGPDFLRNTLPLFSQPDVAAVQTRWGHLNLHFSLITRLQAFGLDAHFTVEQNGRQLAGSFINFNGTAGIWRKAAIEAGGGWQADTLTEDLDLSYRVQMAGWKIAYRDQWVAPGELPVLVQAVKNQQFRWTKGTAETARKLWKKILTSHMPLTNKLHAFAHLFNGTAFIFVLLAGILSIPALWLKYLDPSHLVFFKVLSVFVLSFFMIAFFYWEAVRALYPLRKALPYFLLYFPLFLTMSLGMALHNSLAVFEGLMGVKSPFIRTPKFNVLATGKLPLRGMAYTLEKIRWQTYAEFLLGCYFLFGVYSAWLTLDFGLLPFHLMLTSGFLGVSIYSVLQLKQ
jgi:cellulose synthase/poly-beta-1,6-N-acetylglucosamine synthase-like glycosyltransferase